MRSNPVHEFTDDPEGLYLSVVQNIPPFSPDEEIRCLQHIGDGDEHAEPARKRLLEANLHSVVPIARRYCNESLHFLDLIVKGNEGLMCATYAFGDGRENGFPAYAAVCVERAIEDSLR